jgi:hypothetical protein
MWRELKWAALLALLPGVAGFLGCGLDDPVAPALEGPSELALSVELRAIPDQLTADGFSSSVIEAVVRNHNGARVGAGAVTIVFDITTIASFGTFFDLGNIAPVDSPRPIAGGEEARTVAVATDGQGVARARYWAPFRTDSANDTTVTITARPAGSDFRAAVFRQVDIFLRAADRPSFPGTAACGIQAEPSLAFYPVGTQVFLRATQVTGIVRYEWQIIDPAGFVFTRRQGRETDFVLTVVGTYTIVLAQTASDGSQTACTVDLDVIP